MPKSNVSVAPFIPQLVASGEMANRIREFEWQTTSLDSFETWSQTLRTAVSMILHSRYPMFIWWGHDLIQFYNDAYREYLGTNGKHPKALGQKGRDCWPEIWSIIAPLIEQVLSGGESIWSEDQLIPIYRNDELESVYWTFSYSRIDDESGKPAGILVICNETTSKVHATRELQAMNQKLEFTIESAELGIWDLDLQTGRALANDRLKSWLGVPVDEPIALDEVLT